MKYQLFPNVSEDKNLYSELKGIIMVITLLGQNMFSN